MKKIAYILPLLLIIACSKYSDYKTEYLDSRNKEPFGLFVIKNEIPNLFPAQKFIVIKHNFVDDILLKDTLDTEGNYIAIADKFSMNTRTSDELLNWVGEGNVAFIAANSLKNNINDDSGTSGGIAAALGLTIYNNHENIPDEYNNFTLKLTAYNFKSERFEFKRYLPRSVITNYNSNITTILGTYEDASGRKIPNFVRVSYGDGFFYIHTQPLVFSNHFLLQDKQQATYAAHCLSYLMDDGNIYWDSEDTFSGRSRSQQEDAPTDDVHSKGFSLMRYFMSDDSLRMALYTFLVGTLLLIALKAKRRQRVIPIIKPLENTTVAFTKMISNLYLTANSNNDIAAKKISYFYEKIRTELRIDTQYINAAFITQLQQRTGYDKTKLTQLFTVIQDVSAQITVASVPTNDLLKLDQAIHDFYIHTKLI